MNKKSMWKIAALFLGAVVLTGCTESFTTVQDKANTINHYDISIVEGTETTGFEALTKTVIDNGYIVPSNNFFNYIEKNVAEKVIENYPSSYVGNFVDQTGNKVVYSTLTVEKLLEAGELRNAFIQTNEYAVVKFAKEKSTNLEDVWSNYDSWIEKATSEGGLTVADLGSKYFFETMKATYNGYATANDVTITPEDGVFGGVFIEGKSFGDAWSHGPIEGLLVWPIAAMLYYFTIAFSSMGAFGTILAILLVTIIVRGVLILCTFKQTMGQQKMTQLQPELARIQAKYPNANTNQYEKQQMAQEQMNLYKKNKINPFGMFIVMIFQFPIFIAVWGAMSGSAILREGELFGLSLAAPTGSSITNWTGTASVVALVIFIIMSLAQAVSMLLPQYLQKRRTKKVEKLKKNPAQDQMASQMKVMNIVMLVMIIFMGFSLPVAMAIYWIISALVSLTQSLIMSAITNRNLKKNR